MAEIGLAVAQTLLATLQCTELKNICSIWGYESQLQDLEETVVTIKNVLEDAESKELTKEARGYIEKLKDAVYEADDLFDEFVTLLELKQLRGSKSKRGEFFQKVRDFFSSDQNQVRNAYRMFHNVKKIQKKLRAIAENHKNFKLDVDFKPICMRGEETCSYVYVEDIVGRDDDKKNIIDMLLESKNQGVSFLTIVGVGGLGKTALAQLVYNDRELKQEFGDFYWVCVSDQDQQQFDVKAILCKIVEVVMRQKSVDVSWSLENIQNVFQEKLGGKKYLLVLDDVWNEDLHKWNALENFLMSGQGGSRVLVTTRSEITAANIRHGMTYRLQGLSTENSWHLFEMSAFGNGVDQQAVNHIEMVNIGRSIVEKCNNVPLAIKVVGSLLFGQGINKWRSFEKSGLAQIDDAGNKIMSVLKLSYHNLQSSLKSCFRFCAVFPKDFVIEKRLLINLWMAQGYIMPSNGGESIEDAAEEHFSILLRRCFFQNVKKDEYGDVESVKIHDLMHDVAQEVGVGEIQVLSSVAYEFGDRTRHVSLVDKKCFESSSNWTNLRSLIRIDYTPRPFMDHQQVMDIRVGSWRSLRVLDLRYMDGGSSLESIGKMQHLRYLDLSKSNFKELPSSITKLHNLQTLNLYLCRYLRQLPHGFSKLVKLSQLNLRRCSNLTSMPMGLDKLTGLRVLTRFVAGEKKNKTGKECDDELKDLGTLTNLTGCIQIDIGENYRNVELMKDMNEGYLSKIPGLKEVKIFFSDECIEAETEAVLEKLQPHRELEGLVLYGYEGKTIPRWGRAEDNWAIFLPNLIKIEIEGSFNLVYLPSFSKLPHLKIFKLVDLTDLEYIEKRSSSTKEATDTKFFPSLESLKIEYLQMWKGWFGEEGLADADYGLRTTFRFPCLSKLDIKCCPNLASFPPCPSVEDISLEKVNKPSQLLKKIMGKEEGEVNVGNCTSSSSSSSSSSLHTLDISFNEELESLSEFENAFGMCASSLQSLSIGYSVRMQYLTTLESRQIMGNEDIMPWKPLHQNLRSLKLHDLNNITSLPKGMQYLTSLQTLLIRDCERLESLPEWISSLSSLQSLYIESCKAMESLPEGIQNLTSLQNLNIVHCDRLKERCREPDGEDWPKIQHIPNIKFGYF